MYTKNLFLKNAYELKLRFIYYIFTLILTIICCYIYSDEIIYIFVEPIISKMNSQRFIFTNLKEIFFMYFEFALIGGFFFSLPILIGQIFFFFINGLFKYEIKIIYFITFISFILFFLGFGLGYYYIMPSAWDFFLLFEQKNNFFPLHFEAKLNTYLFFTLNILLSIILSFQLPTVIFLFLFFKDLTNKVVNFFSQRKLNYLILISLSTLISTPEIINQLTLSGSFLIIYEISLFFIFYSYRLKKIQ